MNDCFKSIKPVHHLDHHKVQCHCHDCWWSWESPLPKTQSWSWNSELSLVGWRSYLWTWWRTSSGRGCTRCTPTPGTSQTTSPSSPETWGRVSMNTKYWTKSNTQIYGQIHWIKYQIMQTNLIFQAKKELSQTLFGQNMTEYQIKYHNWEPNFLNIRIIPTIRSDTDLWTKKVWKSWGPWPTVSGCWTMTRTMPLLVP